MRADPTQPRVNAYTQSGQDRYLRTYPADTVEWTPPDLLAPLITPGPMTVPVVDRIEWQRCVAAAAAHDPGVEVESVTETTPRSIEVSEVPGVPLQRALASRRARRPASADAERLGRWLARLHRTEPGAPKPTSEWLDLLDERLVSSPPPGRLEECAREVFAHLKMTEPTLRVGLSHGDLSRSNVLWSAADRRWGVIDFEHGFRRPAAHDLAVLFANMIVSSFDPRTRPRVVFGLADALAEGYRSESGDPSSISAGWLAALAWTGDDFLPRARGSMAGRFVVGLRLRSVEAALPEAM